MPGVTSCSGTVSHPCSVIVCCLPTPGGHPHGDRRRDSIPGRVRHQHHRPHAHGERLGGAWPDGVVKLLARNGAAVHASAHVQELDGSWWTGLHVLGMSSHPAWSTSDSHDLYFIPIVN